MAKKTTEQFIADARSVHGDKYDYSKTVYTGVNDKVCIICHDKDKDGNEHGEFWQSPSNHLRGKGCPKCKFKKLSDTFKMTTEEFIRRATSVHGDKYDYSKVEYVNANTNVCIICHEKDENGVEHGEFFPRPSDFLNGTGCPKCWDERRGESDEVKHERFLKKCIDRFGDKLDFSEMHYTDQKKKVTIICPIHGRSEVFPDVLMVSKYGCPKCGNGAVGKAKSESTLHNNVKRLMEMYGDKYDFSETEKRGYSNGYDITFRCPKHGMVTNNIYTLLYGGGCRQCKLDNGFIESSKARFGDKYDYSEVHYVNHSTPVILRCEEKGRFEITPEQHFKTKCGYPQKEPCNKKTTLDFINKAVEVHGDKFDYSKVEYRGYDEKVCIICPEHGEFWQRAGDHLSGKGCMMCYMDARRKSKEEKLRLKEEAREKREAERQIWLDEKQKAQEEKLRLKEEERIRKQEEKEALIKQREEEKQRVLELKKRREEDYKLYLEQLKATKETDGQPTGEAGNIDFDRWADDEREISRRKKEESFIARSREIHGEKYDYTRVVYINSATPTAIICPEHGVFMQRPNDHLQGQGCVQCAYEKLHNLKAWTTEKFIEEAKKVHGDEFDYSHVQYFNMQQNVEIICPKHGSFFQNPYVHLQGCGCPQCVGSTSTPEKEILEYMSGLIGEDKVVEKDRTLLNGFEVDVFMPDYKLGIEFDGLYWHSEEMGKDKYYHLNKTEMAESKGYHLIHIFEDEWRDKKEIVLSKLRHFIGKDNAKTVGARKCTIMEISFDTARDFLDKYHIQGFVPSTKYIGAFFNDELLGVMTFTDEKEGKWNLSRFATDMSYSVPGLANKIFKFFLRNNNVSEVKTFLDRRWSHSDVNVYDRMGFELEEVTRPDYYYVKGTKRFHKFGLRKSRLISKFGFPDTMTESEMAKVANFLKIWNCGLYKYVWHNI